MKNTILSLVFAVLFVVAFSAAVSAADVYPTNIIGNNPTVSQGQQFTVTFTITNNQTAETFGNITLGLPSLNSIGSWTSAKLGSDSLSINNNKITFPTSISIAPNSSSQTVSLTFTLNSQVNPDTYSGQVNIDGVNLESGEQPVITDLSLSVTVSPSSSLTITKNQELSRTQNGSMTIKNTGNSVLNGISLSSTGAFTVKFNPTGPFNLGSGQSTDSILVYPTSLSNLEFGDNIVTITATSGSTKAETTFNVQNTFCSNGEQGGNLTIDRVKINRDAIVRDDDDDDDETWLPGDTVEVTVKVSNDADDDVDNVQVELGLFDSDGTNVADDLDYETGDEQIDLGDLNDGDDDEVVFTFKVPADLDEGDYKLAVKAYSDDIGESNECVSTVSGDFDNDIYQTIDVQRETDDDLQVVVSDIRLPTDVTCGDTVTGTAQVVNVGDQNQEQILVSIDNSELGIHIEQEIREDLDEGEDTGLEFSFTIPNNAKDKTYRLDFSTQYNYDDGNYEDELQDPVSTSLKVIGCGSSGNDDEDAAITAFLDSDAIAGQEMTVRATIINTGSSTATFRIDAEGYQSWASLDSVSPETVTIAAGESKSVLLTFNLNDDAEGQESFTVTSESNGNIETRQVQVNIEGDSSGSITGFSISNIFGKGSTFIVLAIVNVLLILLIIVVAIRISRR